MRRFASTRRGGEGGGVARGGGWNILPSTSVAAKRTSADGGRAGVSLNDEELEEVSSEWWVDFTS